MKNQRGFCVCIRYELAVLLLQVSTGKDHWLDNQTNSVTFCQLRMSTKEVVEECFAHHTFACFICDDAKKPALSEMAQRLAVPVETLNADGSGSLPDAAGSLPERFETVDRAPDDLAAFLYTSGTTGRSKGAMLTQNNLLSNSQALTELWQITDQDRLIHALPIFHTHGLFVAVNTSLLAGATMDFMPAFNIDALVEAMGTRIQALAGRDDVVTR